MAVLGYFAKLKRGLGVAFSGHFLHDFSMKKCSLLNTQYMEKVSMSDLLSFWRYQTCVIFKFLYRQLMTS